MSHLSLADIVGHPQRNGIYRLAAGLNVPNAVVLAGSRLTGKPAMLAAVAEALALPDWFGHNWDALQDCLADLSWRDGGVTLVIGQADLPAALAPDSWPVLLDILADVANYWRGQGRPFAVFLQGGHPPYPLVSD
ncbi:MAG: barstar family protein [Thiobacillus sp.]|nr:barstar family protein [Thiobacillus sp.]